LIISVRWGKRQQGYEEVKRESRRNSMWCRSTHIRREEKVDYGEES